MSDRTIREAVQYLAGNHQVDRVTMIDAIVNSVDIKSRTCDCTATTGTAGSDIPNTRLMSSVDDGVLILPAIGSTVTILMSIFCDPIILSYTEVDQIVLRGGDLGGLVTVQALTTKLNNIENLLNDLVGKFNMHTHNVTAVGSPTGPNLAPENKTLTTTVRSDIENTTITQG